MVTTKKTRAGVRFTVTNGAGVPVWSRMVTHKAIKNRDGIRVLQVVKRKEG